MTTDAQHLLAAVRKRPYDRMVWVALHDALLESGEDVFAAKVQEFIRYCDEYGRFAMCSGAKRRKLQKMIKLIRSEANNLL